MIIPEAYREAHIKGFKHYLATGQGPVLNKRVELPAVHRDGHQLPIEMTIRTIKLGDSVTANAFLHDITERKQADNRLITQHAATTMLAESGSTSEIISKILKSVCEISEWDIGEFWKVDKRYNVLRCAEIWHLPSLKITDFIAESKQLVLSPGSGLLGKVWASGNPLWVTDIIKDDNSRRIKIIEAMGLHGNFVFPVKISNKTVGVISFFSRDPKPPDENLLNIISDISTQIAEFIDRKELKAKLHLKEERLSVIFNSSSEAMCFCTLDGFLVDVNYNYENLTGYSKEELLAGKKFQDLTPPEYYEFEAKMIENVIKTGDPAQFKTEYIRKNGSLVSILLTVSLLKGADGKPVGLGVVIKDMSSVNQPELKWPPLKKAI